jgi:iron complex transport system permease protein
MTWLRFLLLGLLTAVLFILNIFFGAVHIDASVVLDILTGYGIDDDPLNFIILESRLPQAITALLAGAALGVSGLLLQTAFRNPLAGPSVLGISSGASLGVALVILFMGGQIAIAGYEIAGNAAIIAAALAGSLAIMALLMFFSMRLRSELMLLVVGMMTGYLTSSVVTLLSSLSTAQGVHGYVMWGMGTFGAVSSARIPVFTLLVAVGLILSLLLAKPLNLLLLGDNYARNLGVRVHRVRNLLLLVTGVLTAIVTAYCGPVAFIGLAMPHVARMIMRTDNHWILIPATMLSGAAVALGCNVLSVLPDSTVIPVNALTPVVGVPVILYVIFRRK